jgi:hypothetical protein
MPRFFTSDLHLGHTNVRPTCDSGRRMVGRLRTRPRVSRACRRLRSDVAGGAHDDSPALEPVGLGALSQLGIALRTPVGPAERQQLGHVPPHDRTPTLGLRVSLTWGPPPMIVGITQPRQQAMCVDGDEVDSVLVGESVG